MLRTPSAIEGEGGAISEDVDRAKNRMLQVRDQMAQLAAENGLKVSASISLFHTPDTSPEAGNSRIQDRGGPQGLGNQAKSLLPTPNTMDHLPARTPEKIAESKKRTPGGYANIRETVVNDLFPTVVVTDSAGSRNSTANRANPDSKHHSGNTLTDILLPTVTTQDGKNTGGPSQFERNTKPLNTQVLVDTEWGKFAPAVSRWEQVIGREAPAPTKPDGKDGNHRLSSEFTEWMMGLPAGWITDVGLTRNEELKACGNGVVPQQAVLALRNLLEGVPIQSGGGL